MERNSASNDCPYYTYFRISCIHILEGWIFSCNSVIMTLKIKYNWLENKGTAENDAKRFKIITCNCIKVFVFVSDH